MQTYFKINIVSLVCAILVAFAYLTRISSGQQQSADADDQRLEEFRTAFVRASNHEQLGEFDRAISGYEAILKEHRKSPLVKYKLAFCYQNKYQTDRKQSDKDRVIELLASALRVPGKGLTPAERSYARQAWESAILPELTIEQRHVLETADTRIRQAQNLQLEKKQDVARDLFVAAVKSLDSFLRSKPEYSPALLRRSIARYNLGRDQEAYEDCDKFLRDYGRLEFADADLIRDATNLKVEIETVCTQCRAREFASDEFELAFAIIRRTAVFGRTGGLEARPVIDKSSFSVGVSAVSSDPNSASSPLSLTGVVHATQYPDGSSRWGWQGAGIPGAIAPLDFRGTCWRGTVPSDQNKAIQLRIDGETGFSPSPKQIGFVLQRQEGRVVAKTDNSDPEMKLVGSSDDEKISAHYFELLGSTGRAKHTTLLMDVYLVNSRIVSDDDKIPRLVGYWPFDEDSQDRIRRRDGTVVGNTQYVDGCRGKAIALDGKANYVQVAHNEIFNPRFPFSIALWFKVGPGAPPDICLVDKSHQEGPLMCAEGPSIRRGWCVQVAPDGKVNLGLGCNTEWVSAGSKSTVRDEKWHHLVCVNDKNAMFIYLDSKLEGTLTTINKVGIGNKGDLVFGAWNVNKQRGLVGAIDDLAYFQGALNQERVRAIYENGVSVGGISGHGRLHKDAEPELPHKD